MSLRVCEEWRGSGQEGVVEWCWEAEGAEEAGEWDTGDMGEG
jgi:hypothetical protein